MNEHERLSRQLQAERLRCNRSQSAAAKLLGCTPQAISNWERGYTRIDCVSLFRLLRWYGTDIHAFLRACGLWEGEDEEESGEGRLRRLYLALDERDRQRLLDIAAVLAEEDAPQKATEAIPLYRFLAAAGYPSPQPGEDFDELEADVSLHADFAARVDGDSMEPVIHSGEIIYCRRTVSLSDGDVGLFYAGDGMVCKQFFRDSEGGIHLFSVNRAREDADLYFPGSSSMTVICYGRVILPHRIPLPPV